MRENVSAKVSFVLTVCLFLAGFGLVVYPAASNYLAEISQSGVIEDYQNEVGDLKEAQRQELLEKAREYNRLLEENVVLTDPFDAAGLAEQNEEYEELLNTQGNGMMGYLEVPQVDIFLPVYHGTADETLKRGAGHLVNSSLPVGGKATHAVLSAHRGLPSAKLFTDLDKVQEKDVFYLHILGETYAYEINQIKVVLPQETRDLLIDREEDYVTLVTCTPYGVNSHRLLVRGTRIPYRAKEAQKIQRETEESTWRRIYLAALGCGVLLLLVVLGVRRYRKRHEKE